MTIREMITLAGAFADVANYWEETHPEMSETALKERDKLWDEINRRRKLL